MRRAVILLATITASLAAQPASIEGTVVDQTTGKPLDRVHVRLTATEVYGAMSDFLGHFSIAQMPQGKYIVAVERSGYVQVADSERVTLRDGQQLTDFKVKMARAAMLAGRVVDQYGDPVEGTSVRPIPVPPAKLSPSLVFGESLTDDRGEFHILTGPGKYYLEAEPQPQRGRDGPPEVRSDGTSETVYSATYYPSATSKERASVVEVTAGHDIDGIEIHLAVAPLQRVSGVSGTVLGVPAGWFAMVQFWQFEGAGHGMATAYARGDGKFSVTGLPLGGYDVSARTFGTGKALSARTRIRLDAADVTGVELTLREAGEVTGTLEMVADAPAARKVQLKAIGGGPEFGNRSPSGEVGADGSFHITGVWPTSFRVVVDPLPETAYVKAVEVDGSVVKDGVVEVFGDRVPRLKIKVALDGAAISGKVSDKNGEDLAEGVNILLLSDAKEVTQNIFSMDGKYLLKGILPGKYRVIATRAISADDELDTAKLLAAAEEIELHSGDRIHKDLRLPDASQ